MNDNTFYLLLTIYIIGIVLVAGIYSAIQSAKHEDSNPWEVVPMAFCFGLAWPLGVAMGILTFPFFGVCALTKYIMRKKRERKEQNNRKEVCRTI